ncbi:MAG: ribose-phosphate diphosphokinase [Metallosphaera yellowstonensis]|jgi:ribose-phosphate pyrophosphokinase|uniref:Ribose-phosphate pyrophosphokinase n=1 Tax=Metallosphaera yellowstonensis MK1 TaxID=671065 RepID=H2C8N6_9CREN|nr:ribose-phosphate diphosphokinase [Metallosphaera yellowstonensis]EHP68512.1 ribose-phosphate pyrophosphokinase [Metallosphaera yellowstonensis MK1]
MIIVGGTSTNGVDGRLSKLTGYPLVKVESKLFPDGESYIRIPASLDGEEVVLVQTTQPPQNKNLLELLLTLEAIRDMGATKITAVVPYLAYLRQDRRFTDGEALSAKTILNLIHAAGANTLVVVEPHHRESMDYFPGEVRIVDPIPSLAREARKRVERPFVLAPDRGALERAERLAKELETNFSFLEKERDRKTGEVRIRQADIPPLNGYDVILVDDIISTGGTLAEASRIAYSSGARSVISVAVHLLLVRDAMNRLREAGIREVIGTNTVVPEERVTLVDVSDQIAVRL